MDLPKVVTKSAKRVGRGYGSGKGGHTTVRGAKGQKARRSIGILFEGVKMRKSLLSRLPLQQGKGKFKAKNKPVIINIEVLNILADESKVDIDALVKAGIVRASDAKAFGVKILGGGKLEKKLTI